MQVPRQQMVLTCGVTGSGKTTVSQHLLESLGALRVRSDVERKRLGRHCGDRPRTHSESAQGCTTPPRRVAPTSNWCAIATVIVDAGFPAIVDATFLRHADRQTFRELAERLGAQPTIVFCEAPRETLRHESQRELRGHRRVGRHARSAHASAQCVRNSSRRREDNRQADRYRYRSPDAAGAARRLQRSSRNEAVVRKQALLAKHEHGYLAVGQNLFESRFRG